MVNNDLLARIGFGIMCSVFVPHAWNPATWWADRIAASSGWSSPHASQWLFLAPWYTTCESHQTLLGSSGRPLALWERRTLNVTILEIKSGECLTFTARVSRYSHHTSRFKPQSRKGILNTINYLKHPCCEGHKQHLMTIQIVYKAEI